MSKNQNTKIIKDNLSKATIIEQMAEECAELTQALLKLSRKIRNENPSPVYIDTAMTMVIEEFSDVMLCAQLLDIKQDENIMNFKLDRWAKRLWKKDHPNYSSNDILP